MSERDPAAAHPGARLDPATTIGDVALGVTDLARTLYGLAAARWPLTGASDHLVSEALYLNDPDGNGIEIYPDRPRSDWPRDSDGAIEMATLALDLDDLIGELSERPSGPPALTAGTVMGHVHLQVSSIGEIERCYETVLGFDVTVRRYPGTLFASAGGYHHHVGLNSWNSRGGATPGPRSAGLRWFRIRTGSTDGLSAALERVRGAGIAVEALPGGALVADPSGNRLVPTA